GGEAFYNYSKNNYDVSVAVPDPVTKNPSRETVELFHNGYKGYYAEGHIGLKDKNWADMLKFSLTTYGIDREIQHPTLMNTPYGAITSHQESIVPTIRYKKSFFDSRLKIDQFFAYNTIHKNRIDTTHGNYDWYGHFNPNPSVTGESAKPSDSKVHFRHFTSRTNVSYDLSPKNELDGNLVVTNVRRKGKDPFGKKFHNTEIDILTIPATYMKTVAGLGWKYHILNRKLTNNLIVKYYGYRSKGADAYRATPTNPADIQKVNDHSWGIAEAVKYEVNTNNLLRLSIEYANRLPNQKELFGDGGTKVSNFDLTPERSLNLNLNYRLQKKKYYIETGLYYRQTADMIQLIPVQPPYAQYQNLKNVRGIGFDIDAMVQIWKFLSVSGNVTWNNNRMYNMTDPIDQWKEGSRLRNSPFFFYNLGINTNFNDVFTEKDHLKIYAHYNFIREFYLNFIPKDKEPDGFMGLWGESDVDITTKVPNQSLVSAGINYKIGLVPVNIGIEIKNITDAKLYDYYRVQKPGRSFQLKISYLLN
ncbi:MAG TPA: TonB-dependent receptor, partial [Chitinophagaceae bacterium]|nr:TonB-dependent receptor [Chitinophagaceae bacterium]